MKIQPSIRTQNLFLGSRQIPTLSHPDIVCDDLPLTAPSVLVSQRKFLGGSAPGLGVVGRAVARQVDARAPGSKRGLGANARFKPPNFYPVAIAVAAKIV